jgi:predicted PurR-regulated permease PerM
VEGAVKLFPERHHHRVRSSLHASGKALRLWLTAQLIAMTCVGVLSTLAFWMIGLPYPYALGLIAGLVDFIPFLGPILGAVPAVLIAFTVEGNAAIWTILAVFVIQQIEGNVLVPRVMSRTVGVSPLTVILGILIGSILYGAAGAFLAVPVAAAIQVILNHTIRPAVEEPSDSVPLSEAELEDESPAVPTATVTGSR